MAEKGRPTKYKAEYARIAKKACALGATDVDLAEMLGVAKSTINKWKVDHPDFSDSLKAKDFSDSEIERSLFERAKGYVAKEQKVMLVNGDAKVIDIEKHYPPDTGACVVWLANRKPEKWKKDPSSGESGNSLADSVSKLIDKLPN